MKTVSDVFPNADLVLQELLDFENVAKDLAHEAAPFSIAANGRSLPRFIAETSAKLRSLLIKDFSYYFPRIESIIINGQGADGSYGRIHDACYIFDKAQNMIYKANCVLRGDKERNEIYSKLCTVIGDLTVFICTQFGLYNVENGEIQLSVQKYCERTGITPSVLYGLLLQDMQSAGQSWYAYEPMSPYYNDLNEFDPAFVSECEEANYPLTDDLAKQLLEGSIDVVTARSILLEYAKESTERIVDVTTTNLISRMKLE